MFYDKNLYLLTTADGNLDSWGVYHDGEENASKTIKCDIQPYSSDLLYREYGYQEKVTKRVFCDVDSGIKNGITVKDSNDNRYKIVKIIEWDDYLDVMLNEE